MQTSYLIVAWRNILKSKLFSFINISGLVLGLTMLCYITLYIHHESSFDQHYENANRIYRVIRVDSTAEGTISSTLLFGQLLSHFKAQVTGIEKIARIEKARGAVLSSNNNYFTEEGFMWADPEVFSLFNLPFKYGNPATALRQPYTLVLTETTARKYFGEENPVGKVMNLDTLSLSITGVLKDLPTNTHLDFTMLGAYATVAADDNPFKHQGAMYVRLAEGTSIAQVERTMTNVAQTASSWIMNPRVPYQLQPLSRIHLHSNGFLGSPKGNDVKYLILFGAIAVIVTISTAFNYINLTTARFTYRAKEIGVRKTFGATNYNLKWQFLWESLLTTFIDFVFALALLQLTIPWINRLTGINLTRTYTFNHQIGLAFLTLTLMLGLLAGIYPAIFLSRLKPLEVLKNKIINYGGSRLRELLVILQFSLSATLIIFTIGVWQQLQYLSNKNLGFNKEQLLVLSTPASARLNTSLSKQELQKIAGVQGVTVSIGTPITGGYRSFTEIRGKKHEVSLFWVDEDYLKTLGMELVSGRDFSTKFKTDAARAIIVNEAMVRAQGWQNPVGQQIGGANGQVVVGVVKDFHTSSLHQTVHPAILDVNPEMGAFTKVIMVRVGPGNPQKILENIEKSWKSFAPTFPLTISFLDDQYQALYESEIHLRNICVVFSIMAVFIGCLGLFGLSIIIAEQRAKEIIIRKVLGASVASILYLLLSNFVRLILLACLIAIPLAWYICKEWLENFSYQRDVQWWVFAAPCVIILLIALVTISAQAIRATTLNPADSLRYD